MSTISRNSLRAAEVIRNARNVRVFTPANHFRGEPLPENPFDPSVKFLVHVTVPEFLRKILLAFPSAKLRDKGKGKFSITVWSKEWYEFTN